MNRLCSLIVFIVCLFELNLNAKIDTRILLSNRLILEKNLLNSMFLYDDSKQKFDFEGYLKLKEDNFYPLFNYTFDLLIEPWKNRFGIYLTLDSGIVMYKKEHTTTFVHGTKIPWYSTQKKYTLTFDTMNFEDYFYSSFFIRSLYLSWKVTKKTGTVELGKDLQEVEDGLIYDDYGYFVSCNYDKEPIDIKFRTIFPQRYFKQEYFKSPVFNFSFTYNLSFFEHIGAALTGFFDNNNLVGELLKASIIDFFIEHKMSKGLYLLYPKPINSESRIFYLSVFLKKVLWDLILSTRIVFETGRTNLDIENSDIEQRTVNLKGLAFNFEVQWIATNSLIITPFFLFLSGDMPVRFENGASSTKFKGFISIVPYITYSNIFFNGGINETLALRNATLAGVSGRGVIAAGFTLGYELLDNFEVEAKNCYLFSHEKAPYTENHFYGVEVDFQTSWDVSDTLEILGEFDILFPGNAYKNSEIMIKSMVGLNVYY